CLYFLSVFSKISLNRPSAQPSGREKSRSFKSGTAKVEIFFYSAKIIFTFFEGKETPIYKI
ncbi:MAG: hypothetical protein IKP46_06735, partial [Bacteroidales bacterium]|nr:hypothetical protein [Bacteroidales bacterium]